MTDCPQTSSCTCPAACVELRSSSAVDFSLLPTLSFCPPTAALSPPAYSHICPMLPSVGLFVCVFVGLLPQQEIACIDPHQTRFVCKGSDHLQLIKFWPSRAPRKWVCSGVKIFGSVLLQQLAVFASLGALFSFTN